MQVGWLAAAAVVVIGGGGGGDELFSDRNVFPIGCIVKMEKVTL